MSGVLPALTGTEQTNLATPSTRRTWLVGQPVPTAFATARVSAVGGLNWPVMDISVTSPSANWTSARFGMTVYIGSAAGLKDRGVYFVRKTLDSSHLYIGEIGQPDSGIETLQSRSVTIQDTDYITILETYQLHAGHSRIAYSYGNTTGTFYKFSDLAYSNQNTAPDCYLQGDGHKQYKLPSGSSTVAASVSITPVCQRASQSVSSILWTLPASWTGTSGTTTATVSGNAPLGWHTLYCAITLNDGTVTTIIRYVVVWNETTATPVLTDASDVRDRAGRKITVTFADDLRSQIDSESMVMIIDEPAWSGGAVSTAVTQFVGWLNTESMTAEYGRRDSQVEMLGVAGILASFGADSQRLQVNASPSDWTMVPSELLTLTYQIWYLLRWHVVNWNALFCYYPLPGAIAQAANPLDAAKGNFLAQVQAAALRAQYANAGCDSTGDLHVHLQPSLIDPSTRSVTIRDVLTPDLVSNVTFQLINRPVHRRDIAGAFIYAFATMAAVRSWAPSQASGEGVGEEELQSIIIDNWDNLNLFIGLYYQKNNQRYQSITFTIPGNRDVYEPTNMTRVQYTVDAKYSPTGQTLTGYGIPISVSKRRGEDGQSYIELVLEPETSGTAGTFYPYPPQQISPYGNMSTTPFIGSIPTLTSPVPTQNDFSPATAPADKIKFAVLARNSTNTEFRVVRIDQLAIAPGGFKATDISPTSGQRGTLGKPVKLTRDPTNQNGYFLLCDNGIAYTSNGAAKTVTWTIVNQASDPAKTAYDFTTGQHGWVPVMYGGTPAAVYAATTGWETQDYDDGIGNKRRAIEIQITVASEDVTAVSIDDYDRTAGSTTDSNATAVYVATDTASPSSVKFSSASSGTHLSFSRTLSGTGSTIISVGVVASYSGPGQPNNYSGSALIRKVTVTVSGGLTYISDIAISRGGNVYWLSKKTVSGTDYVFCNNTRNGFKSVGSAQVGRYDANLTYNIQISPYNPSWIWISAGTPGTDAAIYFSSDGGVTFTAGSSLNTRGGSFRLPRALPGGGQNKAAQNLVFVEGINTNLYGKRDGYAHAQIAAGSSDYPASPHTLNSFYLDGNRVAVGLKSRDVYLSADGGKTFAFASTAPGSGDLYSLEVWPSNSKYIVIGGDQDLAYSVDRASTWTNIYSDFSTWATAQFGAGIATVLMNVLPALWTIYRTLG